MSAADEPAIVDDDSDQIVDAVKDASLQPQKYIFANREVDVVVVTTTVSELIKLYYQLGQKAAEIFEVYYNKLEYSGFSGMQPYIAETLVKDLKQIRADNDLIQLANSKNIKVIDYFKIIYNVNNTYFILRHILQIFNDNKINLAKQGEYTSSGHTLTVNFIKDAITTLVDINQVFQHYESYVKTIALQQAIILALPKMQQIADVDLVNKIYFDYITKNKGKEVVDLYVAILKYIIKTNEGSAEGKPIIRHVTKILEELKTNILNTKFSDIVGKQNRTNVIQKLIQIYNLVPDAVPRPLAELLTATLHIEIADKTKNKSQGTDMLKDVAKIISNQRKFGFIVISKITRTPLIYNFQYLIDKPYLDQLKIWQSTEVGINEISLIRGTTISDPPKNADAKDDISIFDAEFGDVAEQNYYYILETLDGTNYRVLVPWNINISKTYFVPAAWFVNIKDVKTNPSQRLGNYNLIMNDVIGKHLTKPLTSMDILSRDEIHREDNYWSGIRGKISRKIRADFEALYNHVFIESDRKITKDNILNLLNDFKLYRNLIYYITEDIKIDNLVDSGLNDPMKLDFINRELIVSYINDLDKLQRGLQKDIDVIYKEEYVDKVDVLIKNNKDNKVHFRNKLTDIYEAVISDVLAKYINRKSNIYLVIRKKFEILEKTIKP